MRAIREKLFSGQRQALWITLVYVLLSSVWIYISNYVLFEESSISGLDVLGEWEAASDGMVVLATAVLLYVLVRRSITRLQLSEQALRQQAEELQALSRKLVDIQEGERRAIAQELHDEIGQALTGLKLSLEMAERRAEGAARENVHTALGLANELMSQVRKLSLDLRPVALDDLGLVPALLWYFERYTRQTGIQVDFRHQQLEGRRFGQHVETAAYRIVQEALTNAARHAKTGSIEIRAWVEGPSLNLHVEDHGEGFDASKVLARSQSSGVTGMQERAVLLGGALKIDTQPGWGTRLLAELPLPAGT